MNAQFSIYTPIHLSHAQEILCARRGWSMIIIWWDATLRSWSMAMTTVLYSDENAASVFVLSSISNLASSRCPLYRLAAAVQNNVCYCPPTMGRIVMYYIVWNDDLSGWSFPDDYLSG